MQSEKFFGLTGANLEVANDINIYYEFSNCASQRALVFLYGLGCNITHWKYQIEYFLQKKEWPHQIIWLDYRGHGRSSPITDPKQMTLQLISQDIKAVLDARNVEHAVVLGQSMGGTVALQFAHLYRDVVDSLVLQGAPPVGPSRTLNMGKIGILTWQMLLKLNQKNRSLVKKGFDLIPPDLLLLREMVRLLGFNAKLARTTDIEEYIRGIFQTDPNTFFDLASQMELFDIHKIDPPIEARTLIIAGEHDMCVSLERIRELEKSLPHSKIHLVAEGSHCPHLDDPSGINEKIFEFLSVS